MSSTSPAVGRALDVLLYLASRPGPGAGLGVDPRHRHAAIVGLSPARGADRARLRRASTRSARVRTGVSAFEVGSAYLRHEPLEHIARPILKRLVAAVGETAHLGILYGAESVYLLKEQPQTAGVPVTLVTDVGVRLPAHLTANGRSILAHLPAAQVRALFPSSARVHPPHRTRAQFPCGAAANPADRARAGLGGGGGHDHRGSAVGRGVRLRPRGPSGCRVQRDPSRGPAEHRTAHVGRGRSRGGAAVDPGVVRTRTRRLVRRFFSREDVKAPQHATKMGTFASVRPKCNHVPSGT